MQEEEIKEGNEALNNGSEDIAENNSNAEANEVNETNEVNNEEQKENLENNEDEISILKKRVEELENEVSDMKDKYMRAMAEAENIRKRTAKEKADGIKRANKGLLFIIISYQFYG